MKAAFVAAVFLLPVAWLVTQERWGRDWAEFGPRTRSFTALWPHRPVERIVSLAHRRLGPRPFVGYFAEGEGLRFGVLYVDAQASHHLSTPEETLRVLTANYPPEGLVAMGPVSVFRHDRFPYREQMFHDRNGRCLRQRTLLVDLRFYVLVVSGAHDAVISEPAERFLRSFHPIPLRNMDPPESPTGDSPGAGGA